MAFDQSTRNRLARFVGDARRLVADEFSRQFESLYGISADGTLTLVDQLSHLDEAGRATAERLRERIRYLVHSHPESTRPDAAAVDRLAREQAFTVLNRLAALRMAEKRGLIVESVGNGYQSKGFKVYETVAGTGLGDAYHRYRCYLFCLFDELAVDLGVLFDRRLPSGLLFPREKALLDLLALLNAPELDPLWAEDETIGWIYQYYNDEAERKKMREQSSAPRNSRELAVRNQFFTPRYVVEFLTDNTLGRLWCEMTRVETALKEQCRYLVRRPHEVFLEEDEIAAVPLHFDQLFTSIIGDPREAHSRVFLQEDPESYLHPSGWIQEAFEGNFENLPADGGDPNTRWVGAAISPPQIDAIIGERWQPMESNAKLDSLRRSILEGNPDLEARKLPVVWAILSDFCRTNQFAGGYEWPTWRKLWSYFRRLAQTWQRFGAGEESGLSQEELLRQPILVTHRPLKDPREIRLLDPACGSMHFGLYAFDLFIVIYDEAWEIAHRPDDARNSSEAFSPFIAFAATFPDKVAFLREIPRLIVEHNIHGIDIDPRAVQIAGLSLWLRAQRAWHQAGVKGADRPRITRSNLVCAEPMPGNKEMLREFVEQQFPVGERPAFGFLLETVFDRMTLAGEVGSLLRIEEEIRTAIADAKQLWKEGPRHEQVSLFAEPIEQADQGEMRLDLSGITDEQFWERAEQRIYEALEAYAEQAEGDDGFQRRLFADDAAQGFAFIDLCRKRYDVAVMNPPFGAFSDSAKKYAARQYSELSFEIYVCFLRRGFEFASSQGLVGVICPRSFLYQIDLLAFREMLLSSPLWLSACVELGLGVMDGATVRTAASVIHVQQLAHSYPTFYLNLSYSEHRDRDLEAVTANAREVAQNSRFKLVEFAKLIGYPFLMGLSRGVVNLLASTPRLDPFLGKKHTGKRDGLVRMANGLQTGDNDRWVRLAPEAPNYEIGQSWHPFLKPIDFQPYLSEIAVLVDWANNGHRIRETFISLGISPSRYVSGEEFYFQQGSWYPDVSELGMGASVVTVPSIASRTGIIIVSKDRPSAKVLAVFLNSRLAVGFLGLWTPDRHHQPTYVGQIPYWLTEATELGLERIYDQFCKFLRPFRESEISFKFSKPSVIGSAVEVSGIRAIASTQIRRTLDALRTLIGEADRLIESDLTHSEEDRELISDAAILAPVEQWFPSVGCSEEQYIEDCASGILAYAVGSSFGRWDIRCATGERPAPDFPDPLAAVLACPPGMLQGDDGLPLSPEAGRQLRAEGCYPLDIAWDGILVDDPEHPLDLERRVQATLAVLWGERADALEQEACSLLGVPTLREWFRRPAGFFADHLKRYSKSRRQAPIYWPLSTASGRYTIWLYYHRLNDQTLHRVIADFLNPKLKSVQQEITDRRESLAPGHAPASGGATRLAELQELHDELTALRTELERIIALPWRPNLNDGVLITASPLWRLFRLGKWQKDLKACWESLSAGEYDWAHLAYTIWPERVRDKCRTDRSLAIAHGLEALCTVEPPKPKAKRKGKTTVPAEPED